MPPHTPNIPPLHRLQTRLMLLMLGCSFLLSVLVFAFIYWLQIKTANAADRRLANNHIVRIEDELLAMQNMVHALAMDWSHWDDTYAFVQGQAPEFATDNISPPIFDQLNIDAIVFYQNDGSMHQAFLRDDTHLSNEDIHQLGSLHPVLLEKGTTHGDVPPMLMLHGQPAFIAMAPVVKTDGSGTPMGHVLFAQTIDPDWIASLADGDALSVSLSAPTRMDLARQQPGAATDQHALIHLTQDNRLQAHILLHDASNHPILSLNVETDRPFFKHAMATLWQPALAALVLIAGMALTVWFALKKWIINRLAQLLTQIESEQLPAAKRRKQQLSGQDELATVSFGVQAMFDRMDQHIKELRYQTTQAELTAGHLKASETHLRAVMEHAVDAVVTIDDAERVMSWNPAAETLFGYTPDEAIGRRLSSLLGEPLVELIGEHDPERSIHKEAGRCETKAITKKNTTIPVEASISWWKTDAGRRVTLMLRDIAQRVQQARTEAQNQTELIQASRSAGRAEIAKAVLQTVGDAVNAMTTNAGLLRDSLHQNSHDQLVKANQLLQAHKANLSEFFANDERAEHLPEFLLQFEKSLANHRQSMLKELKDLSEHLQHLENTLDTHDRCSHTDNSHQLVAPQSVIDDAIRITRRHCEQAHIRVTTTPSDHPAIWMAPRRLASVDRFDRTRPRRFGTTQSRRRSRWPTG